MGNGAGGEFDLGLCVCVCPILSPFLPLAAHLPWSEGGIEMRGTRKIVPYMSCSGLLSRSRDDGNNNFRKRL